MKLTVFGLSLSSSWGNGHATTYRALLKAFARRGHEVDFLEWDAPWYRAHRDLPHPAFCRLRFWERWPELRDRLLDEVRESDAVLVGSYVHEGARIVDELARVAGDRLLFFDIDTPVTVEALRRGTCTFLRPDQVPLFRSYLSFAGGPRLESVLRREFRAQDPRAFHCCVDVEAYRPTEPEARFAADVAYMGTYAPDRQEGLDRLVFRTARLHPSRSFLVAGPLYPDVIRWPTAVRHRDHVAPHDHPSFYASASWQLNLTRADMRRWGWAPSVRLFEAAACGAAILSDRWPGLEDFFAPGREILLPESPEEMTHILADTHPDDRRALGDAARRRILAGHTADHRARQLEALIVETTGSTRAHAGFRKAPRADRIVAAAGE